MSSNEQQYTDTRLYGPSGQPQSADIQQDRLYDCFLLAPMGALAAQQPDRIRDAIQYRPDPNNPNAGVFNVTLHHPERGVQQVEVTQADVAYDMSRRGGSTADNRDGGPVWPAVLETAFAKLHNPNPENRLLRSAFGAIDKSDGGGSLSDGMFALTGQSGQNLRIGERPPSSSVQPPGNSDDEPSFHVPSRGRYVSESDAYTQMRGALDSGRPVTLSTLKKEIDDGLMEGHAYMVTDVQQRDGHTWMTLRNPYARNQDTDAPERAGTSSPTITVRLDDMARTGALGEINLGPAPRVQTQQQSAPEPGTPSQPTPVPASGALLLDNSAHPNHDMYTKLLDVVQERDRALGRTPDEFSKQLAGALTERALSQGLTTIGAAKFSDDGKVVGMTDTPNLYAEWATTSAGNAAELASRPLTQSSEGATKLNEQIEQARALQTQTQTPPTQDDPGPKGPRMV